MPSALFQPKRPVLEQGPATLGLDVEYSTLAAVNNPTLFCIEFSRLLVA